MAVSSGDDAKQRMILAVKSSFEEFSTASTIPGLEEDGSLCTLRPEDDLEDGEIPQPAEPVCKGGLSQLELDELCVTESDEEHRSSTEDGELTEDEIESDIDFELQLQNTSDPHQGDKSNMEQWCGSPSEDDLAARTSKLAPPSRCRDRDGLPLRLSPRAHERLRQPQPSLTSPRRQPSLTSCAVPGVPLSATVNDGASREQLTGIFSTLLSSDSKTDESAAGDLLMQLAEALGPSLHSTAHGLEQRLVAKQCDPEAHLQTPQSQMKSILQNVPITLAHIAKLKAELSTAQAEADHALHELLQVARNEAPLLDAARLSMHSLQPGSLAN